jgi:hypothetical protein
MYQKQKKKKPIKQTNPKHTIPPKKTNMQSIISCKTSTPTENTLYTEYMTCFLMNSPMFLSGFVLVIKEKDLVILKVIKQQYRRLVKRGKELNTKLEQYRVSKDR